MGFDRESVKAAIVSNLPVRTRWFIHGTPLDFDFSPGIQGLHPLPDEAIEAGGVALSGLLIFGESDYAEGGGARNWVCVRCVDGAVIGVDLERSNPTFCFNTSIELFVRTFRELAPFLSKNQRPPSSCDEALRSIDPMAYPRSDWRLMVESLLEY